MATPAIQSGPGMTGFNDGLDTPCDGPNDGRPVTLEQYLHTTYDPDCDFVDGHLQERNLGEFDHGDVQGQIYFLFRTHFHDWKTRCVVEVRLQVKPTRFRIPDVMVLHPGQKKTQIVRQAPLLCIEVLSPEDTFKRLKEKVDEYLAMGVQHIWVFAPPSREAYVCDAAGFHKILTPDISIPNTAIRLTLTEVFSVLDSE